MWVCDWNTNTEEHSLFKNNGREKGEGDYATYLTFGMQQETCIGTLNDNEKEKNRGIDGGSAADQVDNSFC